MVLVSLTLCHSVSALQPVMQITNLLHKLINLADARRNAYEKFPFVQDMLGTQVYMDEFGPLFNFFMGTISVYNDVVQTVTPIRQDASQPSRPGQAHRHPHNLRRPRSWVPHEAVREARINHRPDSAPRRSFQAAGQAEHRRLVPVTFLRPDAVFCHPLPAFGCQVTFLLSLHGWHTEDFDALHLRVAVITLLVHLEM